MPRTLIFIVAYEAKAHIASVLTRLPAHVYDNPDYEVLVIDDASRDDTADVAKDWSDTKSAANVTVLKNPVNQGYGGNQKLGYRYAVDRGFDRVVLLHGDGQYAPESLDALLRAMDARGADVVLGTRMHSLRAARKGGMPFYKILGNRTLTTFQNLMTGQKLSEYHTGYRVYATRFLDRVPFEINTNDFHFDTEILLQAFHAQAKVVEVPIPTHYGDEICRVDGVRYAGDVVRATLQYFLHRAGMFCSLKYQRVTHARYADKTAMPGSTHAATVEVIKAKKPKKLLDIGAGQGHLARVAGPLGVETTMLDVEEPRQLHGKFVKCDLERDELPVNIHDFDMVTMLDVIEHLARPEDFLIAMRHQRAALPETMAPTVVISTPNVAFLSLRLSHLFGRFNYAERGILDITHKRLFTLDSLLETLKDCGYRVDQIVPIGAPFGLVAGGGIGASLGRLATALAKLWPRGFAFQFLIVTTPMPGVSLLLEASKRVRQMPDTGRSGATALELGASVLPRTHIAPASQPEPAIS